MTITGKTAVAGIMGWPVAHSRSPQLHGYWLKKYDIDGVMIPLAVDPDCLDDAIKGLAAMGLKGCNVTIPHKETILPLMDEVSDIATRIGAVNTVIVGEDGRLTGTNTDGFGFLEHLKASVPAWQSSGKIVSILGAGGASRAVIAALLDDDIYGIRLLNRSSVRAQAVAAHFDDARITVHDWDERGSALGGANLVVNATSLGMTGKPALDIDLDALSSQAVVYDLVYAPLETPFLQDAKARGAQTVDGLGMLLHQARPAFKAWYGIDPEVDADLRALLVADLGL